MSIGSSTRHPDHEDYFSETRMSFGDHLEELRTHLWKAIAGFCVALVLGFAVGRPVTRFISLPVEDELQKYWDRYYAKKHREVMAGLQTGEIGFGNPITVKFRFERRNFEFLKNDKTVVHPLPVDIIPSLQPLFKELNIEDWVDQKTISSSRWIEVEGQMTNGAEIASGLKQYEKLVGRRPSLVTMNVQEAFVVFVKVSVVVAFVMASPWIFYQIWSFIAVGLYPHEKRYVNVFLPVSIGLFLAGVFLCQFFVIPKAIEALLWFNEWLELEPDFRLNEWLSFAIFMPLVFGLSFQTPLVMLFCERIGVLTVDVYRSKRRISWFLMAVFAALITPSVDWFSMILLWVPMCLLYELGIGMCVYMPRQPTFDIDVPDSEELMEV